MNEIILRPTSFQELVRFAEVAAESDLMPKDYKGKPANVLIAVQMGSELGLAPMQAINGISIINGRPAVWGDAMLGLCLASPHCDDIQERIEGEGDERAAVCIAKRKGKSPVEARFSVADAKRAALYNKPGPWQQYPERMMAMRARAFALRGAFADVLKGLQQAEEVQDILPEKEVRAEVLRSEPAPPPGQRLAPAELDRVLHGDNLPDFDAKLRQTGVALPQPEDRVRTGVNKLISRVLAADGENALDGLIHEPAVVEQCAWLTKHRPGEMRRIEAAVQERQQGFAIALREPVADE